ncbi:ribonuclease P 40kDa subunit-domain-containing protein [Geopyxis carbonaria]|nr:ribonuclease P 40kDa subunit-domain-containing protein [Geopyxis carbonaria]
MQPPKVFVSLATAPQQLPTKRTLEAHPFNHQVDVLLPAAVYERISPSLHACAALASPPQYYRLEMPLGAILEPDFFNTYVKAGNILLLSHGRLGVDNIFTLSDGVLRLSLDNEAYEKAGLQGRPAVFGNGPGVMKRRRFLVELNLRATTYMTGSKMFTKLQRACANVFNKPTVFLFADLAAQTTTTTGAKAVGILEKFPVRTAEVQISGFDGMRIPSFAAPLDAVPHGGGKTLEANYNREVWRDWAMEVYEYLGLLQMPGDRPADRIGAAGSIDPYLSTYSVGDEDDGVYTGGVTRLRVSGLLSAQWIESLWTEVEALVKATDAGNRRWVSLTVQGFENVPVGWNNKERGCLGQCGDSFTILKLPHEDDMIMYELVGGQDEYS